MLKMCVFVGHKKLKFLPNAYAFFFSYFAILIDKGDNAKFKIWFRIFMRLVDN